MKSPSKVRTFSICNTHHITRSQSYSTHLHYSANGFTSKCNKTWERYLETYKNNIAIIQDNIHVTYNELNERITGICYPKVTK